MCKSMKAGQVRILIVFMAVISLTFFSVAERDVSAKPFRMGKIPDRGANFGCGTCHVNPRGGGPRNPFGKHYAEIAIPAGEKYSAELGAMDSDGDAYSNDQEFNSGTHPGDPESRPAK